MTSSRSATTLAGLIVVSTAVLIRVGAAQQPAGNADTGKRLFHDVGCYQCHGLIGQGGMAGPRIAPWPSNADPLIAYVRHPRGQMPPYTEKVLQDAGLLDIVAYLKSIPAPKKAAEIPLLGNSDGGSKR